MFKRKYQYTISIASFFICIFLIAYILLYQQTILMYRHKVFNLISESVPNTNHEPGTYTFVRKDNVIQVNSYPYYMEIKFDIMWSSPVVYTVYEQNNLISIYDSNQKLILSGTYLNNDFTGNTNNDSLLYQTLLNSARGSLPPNAAEALMIAKGNAIQRRGKGNLIFFLPLVLIAIIITYILTRFYYRPLQKVYAQFPQSKYIQYKFAITCDKKPLTLKVTFYIAFYTILVLIMMIADIQF